MSSHYNQNVNGWIVLDKPQGMSSNQALRKIQYMLHAKKAGHIGTLDPFATGVLPMAFGEATKLIPYLEGSENLRIYPEIRHGYNHRRHRRRNLRRFLALARRRSCQRHNFPFHRNNQPNSAQIFRHTYQRTEGLRTCPQRQRIYRSRTTNNHKRIKMSGIPPRYGRSRFLRNLLQRHLRPHARP